jgi:membrane protein required for beta-lactamase induction
MDEETKKLLREEAELNKENNRLLNELVWYQKWSRWLNIVKWLIVIGTTLGALYYVQPILNNLLKTYSGLLETISEVSIQTLPRQ